MNAPAIRLSLLAPRLRLLPEVADRNARHGGNRTGECDAGNVMAKDRPKATGSKGAKVTKPEQNVWTSKAFLRERFWKLMFEGSIWASWAYNRERLGVKEWPSPQQLRMVNRILKATMLAFHWRDDKELKRAELAALQYLDRQFLERISTQSDPMVDLTEYRPDGWFENILESYFPGDPQRPGLGRPREVAIAINTLRWHAEEGRLDAEFFAQRMLLMAPSGYAGALVDRNVLADPECAVRLRAAFEKWHRSKNNDNFEALLKAGLRALGVTAQAAANLFKAEDQRIKRQK